MFKIRLQAMLPENPVEIMKEVKIIMVLIAAISLVILFPAGKQGMLSPAGAAYAEDDWKTEFEAVCARTQEAAAMTPEELKNLVERCDRLKPRIEKLEETQRKVYLKRLEMCRNLFAFVLEYKEKK